MTGIVLELHAFMSSPGFAAENDGYAVPSRAAREFNRSISAVSLALREGKEAGLFESRPHPTMTHGPSRQPVYEYRAVCARHTG